MDSSDPGMSGVQTHYVAFFNESWESLQGFLATCPLTTYSIFIMWHSFQVSFLQIYKM